MTIRVYLLRHGPAGHRSTWSGDDAERPLTEAGTAKVAQIADALVADGLAPDLILTSPLARCQQTASIVAEALGRSDRLVLEGSLAPGFDAADLTALLDRYPDAPTILFVGHEPDLSEVCAELCGATVELRKGALVELELDRRHPTDAVLVRLEQPAHLLRASGGEAASPS